MDREKQKKLEKERMEKERAEMVHEEKANDVTEEDGGGIRMPRKSKFVSVSRPHPLMCANVIQAQIICIDVNFVLRIFAL